MQVTGRKGCDFFEWHDLVLNICEKRIIIALMKKTDELKLKEKTLKTNLNDMKIREKYLGNSRKRIQSKGKIIPMPRKFEIEQI